MSGIVSSLADNLAIGEIGLVLAGLSSRAEIRTTHVTGLVTDIGIELGKLCYWNGGAESRDAGLIVRADRQKLALLASLLGMFLLGGLIGAVGFKHLGFVSTVPLATILVALAAVPLADDFLGQCG